MIRQSVPFLVLASLCLWGVTMFSYSRGKPKESSNQLAELPSFYDKKEDDYAWVDPLDPNTMVFSVKTADLRNPLSFDSDTYTTAAVSLPIGQDTITVYIRWWKTKSHIPVVVLQDQLWQPVDPVAIPNQEKTRLINGLVAKHSPQQKKEFFHNFSNDRWFDLHKTVEDYYMVYEFETIFYLYPRYQLKTELSHLFSESAKWSCRPIFDLTIVDENNGASVFLEEISFKEKFKMYEYDGYVMDGEELKYAKELLRNKFEIKDEINTFNDLKRYTFCEECQIARMKNERNTQFWRNYKKLIWREDASKVLYFKIKIRPQKKALPP